MADVEEAEGEAGPQEGDDQRREAGVAGELEAEEQASERHARQRHAGPVEGPDGLAVGVLDEAQHEPEAEEADRDVDVEVPAPVEIGDDEAADRSRTRRPTGIIMAPPRPWKARAMTKSGRLGAWAHSTEPSMKTAMAAEKTVRAPNLSATLPLAGMKIARLSR